MVKAILSNEAKNSWYVEVIEKLKVELRVRPNWRNLFVEKEMARLTH